MKKKYICAKIDVGSIKEKMQENHLYGLFIWRRNTEENINGKSFQLQSKQEYKRAITIVKPILAKNLEPRISRCVHMHADTGETRTYS